MLLRIKRSSNQILFFKSNMIEIYKEFNKINSGRATLCSVTSDFTLSLFSFESFNIMSTRVSSKTSGLFKWSSLSPTLYIWGRTREKERAQVLLCSIRLSEEIVRKRPIGTLARQSTSIYSKYNTIFPHNKNTNRATWDCNATNKHKLMNWTKN